MLLPLGLTTQPVKSSIRRVDITATHMLSKGLTKVNQFLHASRVCGITWRISPIFFPSGVAVVEQVRFSWDLLADLAQRRWLAQGPSDKSLQAQLLPRCNKRYAP
jgi:hypothetical protein